MTAYLPCQLPHRCGYPRRGAWTWTYDLIAVVKAPDLGAIGLTGSTTCVNLYGYSCWYGRITR